MPNDAIVFDLGNTLLPWGDEQSLRLYREAERVFVEECGPMPDFFERAFRARDELIREREETTMREVTIEEFVARIHGNGATARLVERTREVFSSGFAALCRFPEDLGALLDRLAAKRPLAVLSNYVLADPVAYVLERDGLIDRFVHVEVSASSGYMKPHPRPFEIVLDRLGTAPERTLMVGDNFYADIVGGRRAGLRTALTRQFSRGPASDPRAPGVRPDRILQSLDELDAD